MRSPLAALACWVLVGVCGRLGAADPVRVVNPTNRSWQLAARALETPLIVTVAAPDGSTRKTVYPAWEKRVLDAIAARGVTDEQTFMDYYNFFLFKFEIPAGATATIETLAPRPFAKAAEFIPLDAEGNREVVYQDDGQYVALWDRPTCLAYRLHPPEGRTQAPAEIFGAGPSRAALFSQDPGSPTVIALRIDAFGATIRHRPFEGFPVLPPGPKPFWWTPELQAAQDLHQGRSR